MELRFMYKCVNNGVKLHFIISYQRENDEIETIRQFQTHKELIYIPNDLM